MRTSVLCSIFLLSACALSQAQPDVPAFVTAPSAESRAELLAAVTSALKVANVTLADDALTRTSTLTIERTRLRDASGRQVSGRDLGKAEQFQLVKSGAHCVLVHQGSGQRTELSKTKCDAEK